MMDDDQRNELKRFITLIDALYEVKCRVVLSAETSIHKIYTGRDHAFEFDRTISRLMEMQSMAYHQNRLSS
jgi:cell division protein ZapE